MKTRKRGFYYLTAAVLFLNSIIQVLSCFAHQNIIYLLHAFVWFLAASLSLFLARQ